MKILLLFLGVFIAASPSRAQEEFHQIPLDSTIIFSGHWYFAPFINTMEWYSVYYIPGEDTLVNELTYSKVYFAHCGDSLIYRGALRNDTSKCFFLPRDTSEELLLFDFNPESGPLTLIQSEVDSGCEFSEIELDETSVLGSIYTQEYLGINRLTYYASAVQIIEGIGSTSGFLNPTYGSVSYEDWRLHCMSTRDSVIYHDGYYEQFVDDPTAQPCVPMLMTSIAEREYIPFKVYPNPANELLIIQLEMVSMVESVELFDATGRMRFKAEATPVIEIDVSQFPSGFYVVRVIGNGLTKSEKILITH